MKNLTLTNKIVIFCSLVVAGSAFYYFVVWPPIHEKELQKLEKERIVNINKIIDQANNYALDEWHGTCLAKGEKEDCAIDAESRKEIDWKANEQIKRAYLKYPPVR
jgi:hypothetical protein